jgi:hypothetical protein
MDAIQAAKCRACIAFISLWLETGYRSACLRVATRCVRRKNKVLCAQIAIKQAAQIAIKQAEQIAIKQAER